MFRVCAGNRECPRDLRQSAWRGQPADQYRQQSEPRQRELDRQRGTANCVKSIFPNQHHGWHDERAHYHYQSNSNATAALGAAFVDDFPTGLTIANPAGASTTCFSGAVGATAGSNAISLNPGSQIPANGSCSVSAFVTSAAAAGYTNTLPAGSLRTNLGANTAPASAGLTVISASAGSIAPTIANDFVPANIAPSVSTRLTIALYNANATAAILGAALSDMLPIGVTLANPIGAATTCAVGSVTTSNRK